LKLTKELKMKNTRIYFSAYGQVVSFNKKQALETLKNVIKNNGAWNLENGKFLKKELSWEESENCGFMRNGSFVNVIASFPRIVDDWADSSERVIEELKYLIERIENQ
jgi:hypothetical protein